MHGAAGLVLGAAHLVLGVVVVLVCSGAAGAGGRAAASGVGAGAAAAGEAAAEAGHCWCWCPACALVVVGVLVPAQGEEAGNYPAVGFGHWCEGLLLKRPACNCVFQGKDKQPLHCSCKLYPKKTLRIQRSIGRIR